ncbi:hypothetical protein [Laspinema sp. D2d]|nr:hypothetical protein [Laspinema sp. D2d]
MPSINFEGQGTALSFPSGDQKPGFFRSLLRVLTEGVNKAIASP